MKHLKIYENFIAEAMDMEILPTEAESGVHFEVESENITPASDFSEGNYIVAFKNSEGEDTTIEICGASEPEYMEDKMVSKIEMVQDSSSDGKEYSVVGYYDENPSMPGEFTLKKVLIEEL